MRKQRVCHIVHNYLPFSQNWLYHQITRLDGFYPVVLTFKAVVNRKFFPLKDIWLAFKIDKGSAKDAQFYLQKAYWPRMDELITQKKPVLLHAHFGMNGAAALAWKKNCGLPLITSFYGFDAGVYAKEPYWLKTYQELFRVGELFLVEGPHMRSVLSKLGCPSEKIVVQRLGVDIEKLRFRARQVKKNEPLKVVMAFRMVEKKGPLTGLRAFSEFGRQYPSARLEIIGEGELLEAVKKLAETLNIGPKVSFIPSLTHSEYLEKLQESHILLQPSQTAADGDMEGGAPVGLLEAQAMGLGVVATNHADIPAYVVDKQSGLLAPEKDWQGLAANLLKLATTPELLPTMGEKGRAHIKNNFNLDTQRKRLEAIYHEVIKSKIIKASTSQTLYHVPFLGAAASILALNADRSKAKKVNQMILKLDKDNWRALWRLAQIAVSEKKFQFAVTCWQQTIEIIESKMDKQRWLISRAADSNYNLGVNYLGLKEDTQAEVAFKVALKYDSELYLAIYHLGSIAKRQGRISEAVSFFEKTLSAPLSKPLKGKTLFHLGDLAARQEEWDKAAKLLKKCLKQLPTHQTARQLLKTIESSVHA